MNVINDSDEDDNSDDSNSNGHKSHDNNEDSKMEQSLHQNGKFSGHPVSTCLKK